MPIGYLWTAAFIALATLLGVIAPRRPRFLGSVSFPMGLVVNELPFLVFYLIAASTVLAFSQGDATSAGGLVALGLAIVSVIALVVIVWRGLRARPALDRALADGLGPQWRSSVDPALSARWRSGYPIARILFAPLSARRRDVEKTANLSYGDAGVRNLLDVYCHRSRPSGAPVLIHLHGGAFRSGRKEREARPLLYRFASQGWVCVSANYRLQPAARFPDYLIDVKKVIAWVRAHGHEFGADPSVLFAAGSSAGGSLASQAGLTQNDPAFQPGFEQADTSVTAVVSLYGYYGETGDTRATAPGSPLGYVRADAPPFLVAHGQKDTLIHVEGARQFVEHLRGVSAAPVVYAELPGGQHAFNLWQSFRFNAVVDAVEEFASWVRSTSVRSAKS